MRVLRDGGNGEGALRRMERTMRSSVGRPSKIGTVFRLNFKVYAVTINGVMVTKTEKEHKKRRI